MYRFFIHSSIDRHLGCFHVLTIVSNAVVNRECPYLSVILISFPLNIYSEVEMLDHMVVLFLIF